MKKIGFLFSILLCAVLALSWWTLPPGPGSGLERILKRTIRQLGYTIFQRLPKDENAKVMMGQDGFLFEKSYVDAYNQRGQHPEPELQSISASTRRLQDRLAEDGITLLLVIAPSKAEIYPEYLPQEADVAGRPSRRSNYQNLLGFLHRDGVNLIDAHDLFLQWKQIPNAPLLFAKGGTHWNAYGSGLVTEQITKKLRTLSGKDFPSIRVTGSTAQRKLDDPDNDLGELANLWTSRPLFSPQIHPVIEMQIGKDSLDILLIGDSFAFPLIRHMVREKICCRLDLFYYYNRHLAYPEDLEIAFDKRNLDLLKELQSRNALIIEVNEQLLPQIGFGFVRDLLRAYDTQDSPPAGP